MSSEPAQVNLLVDDIYRDSLNAVIKNLNLISKERRYALHEQAGFGGLSLVTMVEWLDDETFIVMLPYKRGCQGLWFHLVNAWCEQWPDCSYRYMLKDCEYGK